MTSLTKLDLEICGWLLSRPQALSVTQQNLEQEWTEVFRKESSD